MTYNKAYSLIENNGFNVKGITYTDINTGHNTIRLEVYSPPDSIDHYIESIKGLLTPEFSVKKLKSNSIIVKKISK